MKPLVACLLIYGLVSCTHHYMPPFRSSSDWTLTGNVVANKDMKVDFGGGNTFPIANASDGNYELNFITNQGQFKGYNGACAKYLGKVLSDLPMGVDSVEMVLADQYLILSTNESKKWKPDYVRRSDGSFLVAQANPAVGNNLPNNELWRNVIFNQKKHQIIAVDRFVKNMKHYAIVYVLQSECKGIPYSQIFQYDITDTRNIQGVGSILESLLGISVKAMESKVR